MKTLYIVRHAESEGNMGPLQQGPITPLSEKGREQLQPIADRFKTIKIDKIISSPYVRARDTAQAIAECMAKEVVYSDLLIERVRPTIMIGMDKESEEYSEIEKAIADNFHDDTWRYSDEETFLDLKTRAGKLLAYIESLPEEDILIISHGFFMRMILAYVLFGNMVSQIEFKASCYPGSEHENTGISIFRQSKYKEDDIRWTLVTWNDTAHLL
jgi:broad specificity phosphatase PhoE